MKAPVPYEPDWAKTMNKQGEGHDVSAETLTLLLSDFFTSQA